MGLYYNYFPLDDSNLTLRQIDQIELHQELIQTQIEAEIKHDHSRFYGTLANGREIDEDSITELLVDLDPATELPRVINLCHDLVQLPVLQRLGFHTSQSLIRFINYDDQISDSYWYHTLDYVDQSFDLQELSTHDYSFIENVYDLHDSDDFKELAEHYYQTGDYE